MQITLLSSGQPSANPRLIKETVALYQAGYEVTVIYAPLSPWADDFDKYFFQKHPQIKFIRAGYHIDQQKWLYKLSRVRRKIIYSLYRIFGDFFDIVDYSTILFGQELHYVVKHHNADLYIAHNLGALPAAIKAARLHKAKVGFDAEDFHRGEFTPDSLEKQQTVLIENKYFPKVNYLTVASPLIGEAYKSLFQELSPIVINNVFPLNKISKLPYKESSVKLRLFWFSQTIGRKRGLEEVIKAMGLLKNQPVSFFILGNITLEMKEHLLQLAQDAYVNSEQLNFLPTVTEDELCSVAATFDIGIGGEIPYCQNREYCLTNKIFTYLLAGNALLLSDTQAQKQFLNENPDIGFLYKNGDPESLANVIRRYTDNSELLKQHQHNARKLAETKYNWEIESKKFLNVVRSTLQD